MFNALFAMLISSILILAVTLYVTRNNLPFIWTSRDVRELKKWLDKMGAESHGFRCGYYCIFGAEMKTLATFKCDDKNNLYINSTFIDIPTSLYHKMNIKRLKPHIKTLPTPEDM